MLLSRYILFFSEELQDFFVMFVYDITSTTFTSYKEGGQ